MELGLHSGTKQAVADDADHHVVLIVDDDNAIAKEMADALLSQGFRVRYMTSARDAADYIESGMPVAVILLDVNMPGTNGMMFIQELRRSSRQPMPRVIVVSGLSRPETIITALRLSVTDYLVKPVKPSELFASVERAFEAFLSQQTKGVDGEAVDHRGTAALLDEVSLPESIENFGQSVQFLVAIHVIRSRLAQAYGIDDLQMQMLIDLAWCHERNKRVSVTGLISGLGIALATGYRRLKAIEKLGLIERLGEANDKRLSYLTLTQKGRQIVDEMHKSCLTKFPELYQGGIRSLSKTA